MTGDEMEEGATSEQPTESHEVKGAEFVPEVAAKPGLDVYTLLLAVAVVAFLVGTIITATELHDLYDVQFWVFTKK